MLSRAKSSFLYPIVWRHKVAALAEGFLSKESLWDRAVFDGAREHVLGRMASTLKATVVGGGECFSDTLVLAPMWFPGSLPNDALTPARVALSVPLIRTYVHPLICGPMLATHAFDLQSLPSAEGEQAHVGAPSVNVEIKLVGIDDAAVERGVDPKGGLLVRGPPVGMPVSVASNTEATEQDWLLTGVIARVMTNGTFKVVETKS